MKVEFAQAHVRANFGDPPGLVTGADQQMHFVSIAKQPPREVRAHKPGRAGDDDPFSFASCDHDNH